MDLKSYDDLIPNEYYCSYDNSNECDNEDRADDHQLNSDEEYLAELEKQPRAKKMTIRIRGIPAACLFEEEIEELPRFYNMEASSKEKQPREVGLIIVGSTTSNAVCAISPISGKSRIPWNKYVSKYFHVTSYGATYQGHIRPPIHEDNLSKEPSGVLPPMLSRDPGRPRVNRKRGTEETMKGGKKRSYQFQYGTYGYHGHNAAGCKGGPTAKEKRAARGGCTTTRGRPRGGSTTRGASTSGRGSRITHRQSASTRGRLGGENAGAKTRGASARGAARQSSGIVLTQGSQTATPKKRERLSG